MTDSGIFGVLLPNRYKDSAACERPKGEKLLQRNDFAALPCREGVRVGSSRCEWVTACRIYREREIEGRRDTAPPRPLGARRACPGLVAHLRPQRPSGALRASCELVTRPTPAPGPGRTATASSARGPVALSPLPCHPPAIGGLGAVRGSHGGPTDSESEGWGVEWPHGRPPTLKRDRSRVPPGDSHRYVPLPYAVARPSVHLACSVHLAI